MIIGVVKGSISCDVIIGVVRGSISCDVITRSLKATPTVKVLPVVDQTECRMLPPFI